ncbi:prepilin peptidase [Candidatus Uhrbacteria bacterium]|nr:prepilin peptidase [Candidatus Uhrbacteria bacterium]
MVFLLFLLGVCIGSFLNVVIFRVPEGLPVWRGRSHCLNCQTPIRPLDLIPVVSFFLLRGRCRGCHQTISWQYPVVELSLGLLFVLVAVFSPDGLVSIPLLVRNLIFVTSLTLIFVYDLRYLAIIDRFTIPAMVIAVILNLWFGLVSPVSMLLGALVLGGFFYGQFALSRGTWVGGGDIRLGALMGFMLGLTQGLVALFIAYVAGAIFGLGLLALKKANRKTPIPFGTFLSIATVVMLLLGDAPLHWYLSFFV